MAPSPRGGRGGLASPCNATSTTQHVVGLVLMLQLDTIISTLEPLFRPSVPPHAATVVGQGLIFTVLAWVIMLVLLYVVHRCVHQLDAANAPFPWKNCTLTTACRFWGGTSRRWGAILSFRSRVPNTQAGVDAPLPSHPKRQSRFKLAAAARQVHSRRSAARLLWLTRVSALTCKACTDECCAGYNSGPVDGCTEMAHSAYSSFSSCGSSWRHPSVSQARPRFSADPSPSPCPSLSPSLSPSPQPQP